MPVGEVLSTSGSVVAESPCTHSFGLNHKSQNFWFVTKNSIVVPNRKSSVVRTSSSSPSSLAATVHSTAVRSQRCCRTVTLGSSSPSALVFPHYLHAYPPPTSPSVGRTRAARSLHTVSPASLRLQRPSRLRPNFSLRNLFTSTHGSPSNTWFAQNQS